MEKIDSFKIDHLRLKQGLYISRIDKVGYEYLTTFDIRMKKPYDVDDSVMTTGSIHAIEHLGSMFLRNDELWKNKIIYFGPMGCRTGFYLIVEGNVDTETILPLIERTFDYIAEYEGEIPGCSPKECGNYIDMDLNEAKRDAAIYYNVIIDGKKYNFNYPKPKESKKN
ncbi:MAG: S-ribosylhomocysteine lyase [Clostridia bacterium]|nr:S-ribosylhomocysteine lyase [Clostridia bacterium]